MNFHHVTGSIITKTQPPRLCPHHAKCWVCLPMWTAAPAPSLALPSAPLPSFGTCALGVHSCLFCGSSLSPLPPQQRNVLSPASLQVRCTLTRQFAFLAMTCWRSPSAVPLPDPEEFLFGGTAQLLHTLLWLRSLFWTLLAPLPPSWRVLSAPAFALSPSHSACPPPFLRAPCLARRE